MDNICSYGGGPLFAPWADNLPKVRFHVFSIESQIVSIIIIVFFRLINHVL